MYGFQIFCNFVQLIFLIFFFFFFPGVGSDFKEKITFWSLRITNYSQFYKIKLYLVVHISLKYL